MNKKHYDIIIIGAGSGGLNVSSFFARVGLSVLLVNKNESAIGGDCLNYGCVPSKALIYTARTIRQVRDASRYGYAVSGKTDLKKVLDEIRRKQDAIRLHENSEYLRSKGMDVVIGDASFVDTRTLRVNNGLYSFDKCVLATGSRARALTLSDNDGSVPLLNNESVFSLDNLPDDFVFLGGGPISCELAQAFRFLGSEVTILNADAKLLGREIQEASDTVESMFKEDGIQIVNRMRLTKIQNGHVFYTVDDKEISKKADALFVGIGRVLNTEGLALEKAGIKQEENGKLIINEYLETTNPHVVAIGDIAGSFMFTHAAEEHAKIVINNMLSPFKKKSPSTLAWVTYISKEVATFGKSETTLNGESVPYTTHMLSFDEEDRSVTDGEKGSFLKVHVDKEGRVLGGTMVAEDAGELVQDLLTIHYNDLSLKALYNKVYPYPTKSRINRRLALAYMGSKLSGYTYATIRFLFRIFS